MEFERDDERRYAESHERIDDGDDTARVEITEFAPDELGDIVSVGMPVVCQTFDAPELGNDDPFDEGWMIEQQHGEDTDGLYTATEYRQGVN